MTTLDDVFTIVYGQKEYETTRNLKTKENGTPLISATKQHNGILGYFDMESKYENVISVPRVGANICNALYQGRPCCINNNCLVFIPKKKFSLNEMFYFVFFIRKQNLRFGYGRQITPERIGQIKITKDIPKWIKNYNQHKYENFANSIKKEKMSLKDRTWKIFPYCKWFCIKKGKRLVISQLNSDKIFGIIPYVSSIDKNNGVSHRINVKPNHKRNTLTINYDGSVGETFYQPEDFWASDSVNVLYPKFNLNPYVSMFLIVLLKKEKYRFNYSRKWTSKKMNETEIYLPVDKNGNPDWKFMEDYIKSLPYSSNLETRVTSS